MGGKLELHVKCSWHIQLKAILLTFNVEILKTLVCNTATNTTFFLPVNFYFLIVDAYSFVSRPSRDNLRFLYIRPVEQLIRGNKVKWKLFDYKIYATCSWFYLPTYSLIGRCKSVREFYSICLVLWAELVISTGWRPVENFCFFIECFSIFLHCL